MEKTLKDAIKAFEDHKVICKECGDPNGERALCMEGFELVCEMLKFQYTEGESELLEGLI